MSVPFNIMLLANKSLVLADFQDELIRPDGRYYIKNDLYYPSVTTLLSQFEDKSFLVNWEERIGKKEANDIRNSSAHRGTEVHKLIENYLHNTELDKDFTIVKEFSKYAKSAVKYFYSYIETIEIEAPIVYEDKSIRYAGRIDTIANILPETFYYVDDLTSVKEGLSVVDLKTKDKSQPTNVMDRMFKYALQGAAYIAAIEYLNPSLYVDYFIIVYSYKTKARNLLFNRELIDKYFNIYYHLVSCFFRDEFPDYTWKDYIHQSNALYDKDLGIINCLPYEILPYKNVEI